MPNIRIKDIPTTASATSSTDFIGIDGSANGTRKLNAYSPTFGGNLTATGTIRFDGQLLCGNAGGIQIRSAAGDANVVDVSGGRNLTMGGAATFGGNLTVSGTGNSSVAGTLLVATTTNSSNGKLQLATHTTSAGGIGFGTDTSLFRSAAGALQLESSATAVLEIDGGAGNTRGVVIQAAGTEQAAITVAASGTSLLLSTGSPRTTALTLDSSQNATFAGTVTVNGGTTRIDGGADAVKYLNLGYGGNNQAQIQVQNDGLTTNTGKFRIYTNSGSGLVLAQTIDESQNATFAGKVTAQQLNALDAAANNRSAAIIRAQNNTTYSSSVLSVQGDRTTTNSTYNLILAQNAAVTGQFIVRDSGNVLNTNNSYGAISDRKLKENIVDTAPKLAQIAKIQIRDYNLIGKTETQTGVIAQELETVFPSLVESFTDRDAEGNDLGTVTKTVKYSQLVPLLVKALQELRIDFETYKAAHP